MIAAQFLSQRVLSRLHTIYEDLPASSKLHGITPKTGSSLREFLITSGSEVELQAGQILFRQNDPGDGMYWIETGLLVVLQGKLDDPRLLTFRYPGQVVEPGGIAFPLH